MPCDKEQSSFAAAFCEIQEDVQENVDAPKAKLEESDETAIADA